MRRYPETLMQLVLEVYEWYGATYIRAQRRAARDLLPSGPPTPAPRYAGKDVKIPCIKYEATPKGIEMCLLRDVEALVFRDA